MSSRSSSNNNSENNHPNETIDDGGPQPKKAKTSGGSEITCFAVTLLKGHKGHAEADYTVELATNEHGLFHLIEFVIEKIMNREEGITTDFYFSHLWDVEFQGKIYKNGWRPSSVEASIKNHIDQEDVIPLKDLNIQVGDKGLFSGGTGSFNISVLSVETQKEAGLKYPIFKKMPVPYSSLLSDDWLSADEKCRIEKLRLDFQSYYKTKSVWQGSYFQGFERAFPKNPGWDDFEMDLMEALIEADCKFKKSWNSILKYAFCGRTESSTSGKWYQLQKYRMKSFGTVDKKILLAKRLACNLIDKALSTGIPKPQPNPLDVAEQYWIREGKGEELKDPLERRWLMNRYQDLKLMGML
jgi:hypothetical protein